MTVSQLLAEYDLSLDDIRWYLAHQLTESILSQREAPSEITRRIWSGSLESELYRMDERFLARLQDEMDRRLTDEPQVRDTLERARMLKMRR